MQTDIAAGKVQVDGQTVDVVHEPQTVEDAARLLDSARLKSQRLLVVGGGTRLAFGQTGGPFDAALSTRSLNRVIHYEPDDMTLAVEPGCTIAAVKALLAEHNQVIALDAAHEDRSTIGGAVATGLSGPRRLAHGSLKDWLIGIDVAGPDGAIARAGGMVVKNVTGFDMMHVHYGALGAFGLITRMNLKVFPRPAASRAILMRYSGPEDAYRAAAALLSSQLQPSSIAIDNADGWLLRARCDAPASAIERLADRIVQTASGAAEPLSVDVSDEGDIALAAFRDCVDLTRDRVVARLSIPASRQASALSALRDRDNVEVCADLGSGLIYVAGPTNDSLISTVRSLGDCVFLALPPALKATTDVFGRMNDANLAVVQRMKRAFDPTGVLNHGRFVSGL